MKNRIVTVLVGIAFSIALSACNTNTEDNVSNVKYVEEGEDIETIEMVSERPDFSAKKEVQAEDGSIEETQTVMEADDVELTVKEDKPAENKEEAAGNNHTMASTQTPEPSAKPKLSDKSDVAKVSESKESSSQSTEKETIKKEASKKETTVASAPSPTEAPSTDAQDSSSSDKKTKWEYNGMYFDSAEEKRDYLVGLANQRTVSVEQSKDMLDGVNGVREKNGNSNLEWDEELAKKAEERANQLVDDYSHNGATSMEIIQSNNGEASTEEKIANWEESGAHNQNMNETEGGMGSATATITDGFGNVVEEFDIIIFN